MGSLKNSAQMVQQALADHGVECEVVELPSSTRTAREAAESIGCTVAQIAKSIVFQGREDGAAFLVIASGVNRIKETQLAEAIGQPIQLANPSFVRQATGFAIGGVPPCGHPQPIATWIDRDLLDLTEIWAAAGTPHAVFKLTPEELLKLTGGTVFAVGTEVAAQ